MRRHDLSAIRTALAAVVLALLACTTARPAAPGAPGAAGPAAGVRDDAPRGLVQAAPAWAPESAVEFDPDVETESRPDHGHGVVAAGFGPEAAPRGAAEAGPDLPTRPRAGARPVILLSGRRRC